MDQPDTPAFDIDRPTLHYPVNDTDPRTNGQTQRFDSTSSTLHADFDPLCGLNVCETSGARPLDPAACRPLVTRFSNEIAGQIPVSTLVFIAEMYARLPVRSRSMLRSDAQKNVFRGSFRTAAEFARTEGRGPKNAADDETWVALPKIRSGKSSDVEAYSREAFAMKPNNNVTWALSTVNEWFVYFCALKFYSLLVGTPKQQGIQTQSAMLTSIASNYTLGVEHNGRMLTWSNHKLVLDALPTSRQEMLVKLGNSVVTEAQYEIQRAIKRQERRVIIEIPDLGLALPAVDKLNAFQPRRMIRKWVEKCRTQEEAAMSAILADDKTLKWD